MVTLPRGISRAASPSDLASTSPNNLTCLVNLQIHSFKLLPRAQLQAVVQTRTTVKMPDSASISSASSTSSSAPAAAAPANGLGDKKGIKFQIKAGNARWMCTLQDRSS